MTSWAITSCSLGVGEGARRPLPGRRRRRQSHATKTRFIPSTALACRAVNVAIGLKGEARLVVGEADTARALGSGDVEVLGTPKLVALFEEATVEALTGVLEPGQSSVGMRLQIDHLQPTPVGAEIVVEANLEKIEGRRITFTVTATDSGGLAGAGKVTRVIVDVDRFMTKCCEAD